MEKTRIEAFSDGVLAIIITIMVLELKVPHGSEWNNLGGLIPKFVCYIMSFIYIGIYWGNHHHLLHTIKKINARIILTNLNLLFWLSLIPFTTAWMGENHFQSNTVALYSANLLVAAIAYYILFSTVQRNIHTENALSLAMKKQSKKGIISAVSYAVSIPLAYINPLISGVIFVLIAVFWVIPDKDIEKALDVRQS